MTQDCHRTGNFKVHFSRQGKHGEFAKKNIENVFFFKYFIFVDKKTLGKWQEHGNYREFGINWSVATLIRLQLVQRTISVESKSPEAVNGGMVSEECGVAECIPWQ